jgi:Tfp pilus assembly protein PilF
VQSSYIREHNYDLAKDVFSKLLNLRPDVVEVMALRANVFIVEGKLLEAEKMQLRHGRPALNIIPSRNTQGRT